MSQQSLGSKSLFQLTWPLFIDIAFHFLTGALNTFMVGQVSYQAVAALAVGNQIFDLCITLFNFIGIGASVVIAQYLGAKRAGTAKQIVHIAIGINFSVGLIATVIILSSSAAILNLMNMPDSLLTSGNHYLFILGFCLVPEAIGLCIAAALRAHGLTKDAMYVTMLANAVTFVGNALLLFGFFGLPKLGVVGVAWSTVAGRIVALIVLVYLLKHRTGIRLHILDCFKWSLPLVRKILKIGLPAAGENLSWMLQMVVVTSFVAQMGDVALATQSYFFQICVFILLFGLSLGLGTEIMIGHMIGARQIEQAYRRLIRSVKIGVSMTIAIVIPIAFGGGNALMSLFSHNEQIALMASHLFLISLILEPGRTFNIIVISSLRAAGDARFPLIMALISMWGVAIPLSWFLSLHLGWGLIGVWIAFACDEWIRGITMYWRWTSRRWQNKSLVDHEIDLANQA